MFVGLIVKPLMETKEDNWNTQESNPQGYATIMPEEVIEWELTTIIMKQGVVRFKLFEEMIMEALDDS